jgi:hypothetical protein
MKMKNKPRRKIRKAIASRNGLREILSDSEPIQKIREFFKNPNTH